MLNRIARKKEYRLTMKDMKPGIKESIFTTEFSKTESANCSGDSRNNSLTQCIIFISFMNFMVKTAVLCVLRVLCGEKMAVLCVLW